MSEVHVRATLPAAPGKADRVYILICFENSLLTLLLAERGHCEHREGGSGERARHSEYKAFIPGIAELRDSVVHVSVL